jgi:cell wall-associated NlpC family hydrolase
MTHWSEKYVGTPHVEFGRGLDGADCWGLACIVYLHELSITLPDYVTGYASDDEKVELAGVIAGATSSPLWVPVTALAKPFDIAVFRRGRLDTHVGLVVHDGLMLHSAQEDCAKIESYRSGAWSHRLTGVYRHFKRTSESFQS